MDFEAKLDREPSIFLRIFTMMSIAIWIVCAAASLVGASLRGKPKTYNPYWAEEGKSENIPSLKY